MRSYQLLQMLLLGISIDISMECSNNSKEIGVCLHTYLEKNPVFNRDFSKKDSKGTLLLDGPKLESDCFQLEKVVQCFTRVLLRCRYMEDFFQYRMLITSLKQTHKWLCENTTVIRSRFLVLFTELHCMERAWKTSCQVEGVAPNVWNSILRLEAGRSICSKLMEQRTCLVDQKYIARSCNENANQVYSELSHVFLSSWCSSSERKAGHSSAIVITLMLLFSIL